MMMVLWVLVQRVFALLLKRYGRRAWSRRWLARCLWLLLLRVKCYMSCRSCYMSLRTCISSCVAFIPVMEILDHFGCVLKWMFSSCFLARQNDHWGIVGGVSLLTILWENLCILGQILPKYRLPVSDQIYQMLTKHGILHVYLLVGEWSPSRH